MKHHISYLYNALFEYYTLHQAEWQTRWHNPQDWGLLSSFQWPHVWRYDLSFSNVCMRPEFMTSMSSDSVYCMCGAAWSSRWLMTQLINGKHACMLVFMPVANILNKLCDYHFFLYLMNFMFHTMLDAACNIKTVHYKSMKCDVFIFTR